ncbi:response regulator transcription factor [Mycobacterium sp. ST-F2]|uniref:LuxR C-terminal-related transcriptional regulator n=1 Tax=Mycobacterium sp. ST-F2 TaxID=1490484 RepID=UPI0009F89972|nr:response regulator transcription factor [Mycobacterium sp. ST-F2]
MGAEFAGSSSASANNASEHSGSWQPVSVLRDLADVSQTRRTEREPALLIVDDCTLYREYLAAVFGTDGAAAPAVAWDLESLLAALTEYQPSLVLLNLDTRDRAMLLRAILEICPNSKVIVLGIDEDDQAAIVACAEAGVAGYHLRTASIGDLLELIRRVIDGETFCSPRVSAVLMRRLSSLAAQRQSMSKEQVLTVREVQILRMLESGLSNRDIADQLCIAIHTVKNHVHNLLAKLGVSTRREAAARFRTVVYTEVDLED